VGVDLPAAASSLMYAHVPAAATARLRRRCRVMMGHSGANLVPVIASNRSGPCPVHINAVMQSDCVATNGAQANLLMHWTVVADAARRASRSEQRRQPAASSFMAAALSQGIQGRSFTR
jgi:hypothetical protein